ncbi:MAG: glycosyltransferase [Rhodospirillaceae bacterium]|nr:glycosyltransferase [Rhodospirillaceae bacterium]
MEPTTVIALVILSTWMGLLFLRGGFWKADQMLVEELPGPDIWPDVVCIIPARDEANTIGRTVDSLLGQDYPGRLSVIVVDDNSSDGTSTAAGMDDRLRVISGKSLPGGWSGKLWAVEQGLQALDETNPDAVYILLTDADIEHDAGSVRRLVAKAEDGGLDLVSLMVLLNCQSFWERLLIPAFVFFFQKLYPYPWVNDPSRKTAAAAGGCMLVRRLALEKAGGLAPIRGRIIDDCALAALLKPNGPIWLGLTTHVKSLRAYQGLGEIWDMVARTAYTQLGYSPLALMGAVAGMVVIYMLPVLLVTAGYPAFVLAGTSWLLMAVAYGPTLRLFGGTPWDGLLLPVAALLYTLMTISSAYRHYRGQGGAWKGRSYGHP